MLDLISILAATTGISGAAVCLVLALCPRRLRERRATRDEDHD